MNKTEAAVEAFKNLATTLGTFASETYRAAIAAGLPQDVAKELTMQTSLAIVKTVFQDLMSKVNPQRGDFSSTEAVNPLFDMILKSLKTGKGS